MKKRIIMRVLFGVPVGISLGYVITVVASLIFADGAYAPCVPELVEMIGSESAAVAVQTVLSAVLGGVSAGASVIWEIDSWSIAKQTGIFFGALSVTMLPIAYLTHWMEHSVTGFLLYFGIFLVIFVLIWVIQYFFWKWKLRGLQNQLEKKEAEGSGKN